jgi:SAM-dependent methyltransferase
MNNYHYVRNTRPQLYWLGLVTNGGSGKLEQANYGKFWQTVRQGKQVELEFDAPEITPILEELRGKNTQKGYYGGSGWANYATTYLHDSNRFIRMLRRQLRPGGRAVIVVGNSIIQGIEFRIDQMLAQLAERHGLKTEGIHLVRNKRVGSSIIDSSVRNGDVNGHREKTQLYDAAVVVKR